MREGVSDHMAWEPAGDAEHFLLGLFKKRPDRHRDALRFIYEMEMIIRGAGGKVCVRTDKPDLWDIMDGRDHFAEPNHLNPAIFDCDTILLAGFKDLEEVHSWWASDEVFELMKNRDVVMEKMSLHTIDGLVSSFEGTKKRATLGDKLLLLEIVQMDSFKPMQRYVDSYKSKAIKAPKDIGAMCNLLFAEGISGVLINEFPVQVACASCWRTRSDLLSWYEAPGYQKELLPLRYSSARCLTVVLPMWEEKKETFDATRRRGSMAAGLKLRSLNI